MGRIAVTDVRKSRGNESARRSFARMSYIQWAVQNGIA